MTLTQAINQAYEEIYGIHAPSSEKTALDSINDILREEGESPETDLSKGLYKALNLLGNGGHGPGPSPSETTKDVTFIDYDGTVLYSYTKTEFLAVEELPPNPTHEGLIAQGWNYTLDQIFHELEAVGACTIGQMYITDDGKTRFYLHVPLVGLSQVLDFSTTECEGTIDWGDGTVVPLDPEYGVHNYTDAGDYVVTLTVNSGSIVLQGDYELYTNTIHRFDDGTNTSDLVHVEIGNGVTSIGDLAFGVCYALTSVTIPDSVTSIGEYAFNYCSALRSVIIPNSVTSIGNAAFQHCTALTSVTIPDSVTSIGEYAFSSCSAIRSVTIPDSVTSIGQYAFAYCYAISSVTIPDGVTSIGYSLFAGCSVLSSVTIPDSVMSIGDSAFDGCTSLSSVTIPDGVTIIGYYAFQACFLMSTVNVEAETPPELAADGSSFESVSCLFYVPAGSVNAYKAAERWSEYADRIFAATE